jgi:hypothetical protein
VSCPPPPPSLSLLITPLFLYSFSAPALSRLDQAASVMLFERKMSIST